MDHRKHVDEILQSDISSEEMEKNYMKVLARYNKKCKPEFQVLETAFDMLLRESKTRKLYWEDKKPYISIYKSKTKSGIYRRVYLTCIIPAMHFYDAGLSDSFYSVDEPYFAGYC